MLLIVMVSSGDGEYLMDLNADYQLFEAPPPPERPPPKELRPEEPNELRPEELEEPAEGGGNRGVLRSVIF